MKIKTRLGILFSIMALIPMLLVSLIAVNYCKTSLEKHIMDHLSTTAHDRAEYAESIMKDRIEFSEIVASRTVLRERFYAYANSPSEDKKAVLISMLEDSAGSMEDLESISLVGLDGTTLASTDDALVGMNYSGRDFFVGGINSAGAYFDTDNDLDDVDGTKLVTSSPVKFNGSVIGVILLFNDIAPLEDIARDRSGLGETVEVQMAISKDGKRKFLFDRLFEADAVPEALQSEETSVPMKMALNGSDDVIVSGRDYRDVLVFASVQYIKTGKVGLVTKIDQSEALKPVRDLEAITTMVFAITLGFAVVMAFYLSEMISKPIKELTKTIESISRGKIEGGLDPSLLGAKDEIGELTRSMDRVLVSLKLAILRVGLSKDQIGLGEAINAKEEAEKLYSTLYKTSADAIMLLDPITLRFSAANPATLKTFVVSDEQRFISYSPMDLSPKYQPDGALSETKASKMIMKAMKEGSAYFEWVHKRANDEVFPATVMLTKIMHEGREMIQAVVRDTSIEKKAEKWLEVFKSGFDASDNSIVFARYENKKPVIRYVNRSFSRIYGYTADEVLGKTPSEVLKSGKQTKEFYKKLWADVLDRNKGQWSSRIVNKRKDGSLVTVVLTINTIFDKDGKPEYFMAQHMPVKE